MKFSISILFVAFFLMLTACKKSSNGISNNNPSIKKDFIYFPTDGNVIIPQHTLQQSSVVDYDPVVVNYDANQAIKDSTNGYYGSQEFKYCKMQSITLTLLNGDSANNWQNFANIRATIHSDNSPNDLEMGSMDISDAYSIKLEMSVNPASDITTYLRGNTMTYTIKSGLRKSMTHSLKAVAHVVFNIHCEG